MNNLPYRPNVCMLLVNQANQIFLGERNGEPGVWQFPQGGVEPELSLEENVLKELYEELGVEKSLLKIIKQLNARHVYDFEKPPAYAIGKWRGQSQTFWLVKFLGQDSDINLSRFSPEFMNYRWCTCDQIADYAQPKRLPGYREPINEAKIYIGV